MALTIDERAGEVSCARERVGVRGISVQREPGV
jgi:hypothetical protein